MAIATIQSWLNSNRNFEEGRELYDKYGSSSVWKNIFRSSGATSFNIDKLTEELELIAEKLPAGKKSKAPPADLPPKDTNTAEGTTEPPEITAMRERKRQLWGESNMLKSTLPAKSADEVIKDLQVIKKNFQEIDQIWKCLDEYDRSRKVTSYLKSAPEIKIPPAEDKLALKTFINNNRSNISKAKGKNQTEKLNKLIAAGEEAQRRFDA